RATLSLDLHKHPTAAVSVFDGKKKEVQVILEEMDGKECGCSPFAKINEVLFFELVAFYVIEHDRLTMIRIWKAPRKELSIEAENVFQMPCLKNTRRLEKFPLSISL
ncbi:hypothetical protein HAX54_018591, partial [Datura stramonium]|nr:hypothetical protein [Datura stramonium]